MARVVITDPADADSTEIIRDLTAKAGELVADRYEADFDALYRRLERFPGSGSPRPALGRLVRTSKLARTPIPSRAVSSPKPL